MLLLRGLCSRLKLAREYKAFPHLLGSAVDRRRSRIGVGGAVVANRLQTSPGARRRPNNKLVLLDFTGSDWCGWCIKLDREVFSKPEFKDYATKNLVLVTIDFPRAKAQAGSLKKQNEELASQYGIQGFPTIVVLNGAGKKVGELGYMEGGPSAFIAELEKLRKG